MHLIAIALALLDFAPVFFLSLGLFFLAQLVDQLDPRCRRMALSGFVLVVLGGLSRAVSNLALALSGAEIPVLATALYVFAGPGFSLMAGALIRARATLAGRTVSRDPWLFPTAVSWVFLLVAFYLNASSEDGSGWSRILVFLALTGSTATCFVAARLGWRRQLHMAAALLAFSVFGTFGFVSTRILAPQSAVVQLLGELLHLASQMAFAFASWRVAAEYHARIGPTAAP